MPSELDTVDRNFGENELVRSTRTTVVLETVKDGIVADALRRRARPRTAGGRTTPHGTMAGTDLRAHPTPTGASARADPPSRHPGS